MCETAYNSGHAALFHYTQIRQRQTSYIPKPLATISAIFLMLVSIASSQVPTINQPSSLRKATISPTAVSSGAGKALEKISEIKTAKEAIQKIAQKAGYVPLEGPIDAEKFIVGPHDVIHLQVWGVSPVDEFLEVTNDGFITIPGYGAIKVAGLTWAAAKKTITDTVKYVYNPKKFAITLAFVRIFVAHVAGCVQFPGSYQVGATGRIWDIIQLAGGQTGLADLSKIKVTHRDGSTETIDITPYLAEGDISANPYLRDGDIVVVPQIDATNGLVKLYGGGIRSGFYGYKPNETISQFLQRSGAFSKSNRLSSVLLIRDGKPKTINLFEEDVTLSPNDVVIIPTHLDSIIVGGLVANGGTYPYYPGLSAEAYVAMAGGMSEKGSIARIAVFRNGKKLSPKKAYPLMPGDVIIVYYSYFQLTRDVIETIGRILSAGITVLYIIDRLSR